jgi:thiamine kinase-like enzyme
MHAMYYDREEELRVVSSLHEHSPVFYRFLARSAGKVVHKYAERCQISRLERVMRRWFDVSAAYLARQPRTLVYGDAYDNYFMVQPGLRIHPIDWEYAAIGVAASDRAQLVASWGPEKPHFITVYLDEFAKHATVPIERRAFEHTLSHCELTRVLQVLYWWEGPYENLAVVDELLDELESVGCQLQSQ